MKVYKLVNLWYSVKFINPRKPERASDCKIQEVVEGYNRVQSIHLRKWMTGYFHY
jgi:hypothetical protein